MNMWDFFKKKQRQITSSSQESVGDSQGKGELVYKIGDRIGGDYLIKNVFGGSGKSGMGIVYLVENRRLDYPFILKTYQDAKIGTTFADQFRKEAEAWIAVGVHPNIVKALWVNTIDFRLFVAAEFITKDAEGRNNVRDYISCGALNPFWVLTWAAQFCYGMRYSLAKGMHSHRDIKPENLMIGNNLSLKITDFGLASLSNSKNYQSGGTPPYMAPEQIITPHLVDHRADIYAFGIVMYEMFTGGQYPYDIPASSKNLEAEFFQAHIKANPRKINTPIFRLIERCLNKNPQERYQNYNEFLVDVQKTANEMGFKLTQERLKSADDISEELYVRAQSLNNIGKREEALMLIEEYIRKYPEDSCGWTEKGKIFFELKLFQEAEQSFLRSIEIFPYGSPVWNNLGLIYSRFKRYDDAFVAFHRALEFDVGNSGALMNLAGTYLLAKQYSSSAEAYSKAIIKYPQKETLIFNAANDAVLMMKEGAVNEAILVLEELTKASPRKVNSWHNLALCYWHNKDLSKAIECFKKVIEISPNDDFAKVSIVKLGGAL